MLGVVSVRTPRSLGDEMVPPYLGMGHFCPRRRTLHPSLLNFRRFLLAHSSSSPLRWFLCLADLLSSISTTSPGLLSPANLLRMDSVSLIRLLMKMLTISAFQHPLMHPVEPHGLVCATFTCVIFNSLMQVPPLSSNSATIHRGLKADLASKDKDKTLNTSAFSHAFTSPATFSKRPTPSLVSAVLLLYT